MIYQIVAIRDSKAGIYGTPNFVVSLGIAIRGFSDEVNRADPQNVLYRHPDDFVLFHLGTFDDEAAIFHHVGIPEALSRGSDIAIRE